MCRCQAYGYVQPMLFSLFPRADPVSGGSGSSSPPTQRHLLSVQHVVSHSAAHDTICCVISLTCDAPRRGGKQRYDYFLSVVHLSHCSQQSGTHLAMIEVW
nr:hypothetical protein [Escherichia coli]